MSHVDAVRRFNRFYTRRIGVLQSSYLGLPFPLPQARVLYEIGQRRECTASELGAELDIDLGYLSRLLQGLKRERLAQATASRYDARREADGAAKPGEGQELQRLLLRAPAVRVVLVGQARLA